MRQRVYSSLPPTELVTIRRRISAERKRPEGGGRRNVREIRLQYLCPTPPEHACKTIGGIHTPPPPPPPPKETRHRSRVNPWRGEDPVTSLSPRVPTGLGRRGSPESERLQPQHHSSQHGPWEADAGELQSSCPQVQGWGSRSRTPNGRPDF